MNAPDLALDQALLIAARDALPISATPAAAAHPAARLARALYDERDEQGRLRDLEPHEQAFLTAVHQIDHDCARLCGEAKRTLPEKAALAVEFSALQRRSERYQAALERYESMLTFNETVVR